MSWLSEILDECDFFEECPAWECFRKDLTDLVPFVYCQHAHRTVL